jgi:hypothetical protein
LKYRTLAAEISCLSAFLPVQLAIGRDSTVDDLLGMLAHYKTDPILLTSLCNFARLLFQRESPEYVA